MPRNGRRNDADVKPSLTDADVIDDVEATQNESRSFNDDDDNLVSTL
jgi:hypothetical protein